MLFSRDDINILKPIFMELYQLTYIIFSSVIYKKANLFKWSSQYLMLCTTGHLLRFQGEEY